MKSRTSWLGKTQTCRFLPAPWCHVETVHAVGTSLRNGEQGLAAAHSSCLGPSLRRGNVGHSTETSVSPAPFLCHHPLQGTIPMGLRDSQGLALLQGVQWLLCSFCGLSISPCSLEPLG